MGVPPVAPGIDFDTLARSSPIVQCTDSQGTVRWGLMQVLWGVQLHETGLPKTLLSVCDCRLPVLRNGVQRTLLFLVLPKTGARLGAVRFLQSHPPVLHVFR